MSEGKWLVDVQEDMPVVEAARRVLKARLDLVRDRLPPAAFEADEDSEHVHQLRVSTRRAAAALRIFKECLPAKIYKYIRKKLRQMRRAAGAARDWDVFLEFLVERQPQAPAAQHAGLDLLMGIVQGQRMAAQEALLDAAQDCQPDLDALLDKTISTLAAPPDVASSFTLRALALTMLTEQLDRLNEAAQEDLQDYNNLHQVRIRGKRLRYAMEIFTSCFDKSFQDKYYVAIEEMQEFLGQANDSHVALESLEAIKARVKKTQRGEWQRYKPGIEAMLRYQRRLLPKKRKLFLGWWHDWQQSGTEAAFARLLKGEDE